MAGPLVVVGGNAGGMTAAAEARRGAPDLEIVVLERGEHVSYATCGIPYLVAGEVASEDDLVHHDPASFMRERGIEVRTDAGVAAIDPEARVVTTADGRRQPYGALVIATGARPVRPDIPGIDLPGVVSLRHLPSARGPRRILAAASDPRVVLIGSGPIGVEMAEAALALGARVTIAESRPYAVPALGEEPAARVARALSEAHVEVRTRARVQGIERAGETLEVVIDGDRVPADLVVLGTGVVPEAGLAREAGCATGEAGAIAVDRRGRTSVEGIWAAGDCAVAHHRVLGRPVWIPLATTATAQGRIVGRDVTGRPGRFPGVLGSWVSRFGEVAFGATGIDAAAAAAEGFAPRVVTREGSDRSAYMPGARDVLVRLVWDEATGRLLGGQMAGSGEVSTRLHTVSTAISAGMTIGELAACDFGYAPPLSPLRDPVELAAAAAVGDAA
ncbi:MAG: FAD-dependent oxidoreductase [Thermoleophilia bacterium]|nr:FAD-dependent oxidoreductase [Thermoleophilia bacterium]